MAKEKLKKAIKILRDNGIKVSKKDATNPKGLYEQVKDLGYAYDEQGQEFYDKSTSGTINFKLPEYLDCLDFIQYISAKISEYDGCECKLMNDIKITKKRDMDNNVVDGYSGSYLMYKFDIQLSDEDLEELDLDE